MDINQEISVSLNLPKAKIDAAVTLMDQGSSVPFIARYRKEVTGGLTDENLRNIQEKLVYLRNLEERKETIFASLKEQNITDAELLKKISDSQSLSEIEDYYRPYKPKKKTRASKAKAAGLEPLSQYLLLDRNGNLKEEAKKYLCEGYETEEKAIQGALDILAEAISDNPNYRIFIKDLALKTGVLQTKKVKDSTDTTFDNYADYSRPIRTLERLSCLSHQPRHQQGSPDPEVPL
jgi:uncharacterized protein